MSIFELPNTIKGKAIKPAERAQDTSKTKQTHSNPEDLEKMANEALADLANKFPAWACGDVQKMKEFLAEASGQFSQARTDLIRQKFYPKAHDLKGQGVTFGYPLITDIAAHICQLITSKTTFSSADLAVLKKDTQLLETVLWKKLKGDGGIKGAQILEELK